MIFNEDDVLDQLMKGRDVDSLKGMLVDETVDIEQIAYFVDHFPTTFMPYKFTHDQVVAVPAWDASQQKKWHMPQRYQDMDIAEYVLGLCDDDSELQRCGEELLLYQQHDLFNLLKYLKYLVDVMKENHVIWGVGRGSSVASFVLYKLGVHRINSMFYNLSITEFLR